MQQNAKLSLLGGSGRSVPGLEYMTGDFFVLVRRRPRTCTLVGAGAACSLQRQFSVPAYEPAREKHAWSAEMTRLTLCLHLAL